MKSHTVPRKLLEQFAYFDQSTESLRLWRYEKDRPPRGDASPRSATRIDHHFNHPDIAGKEEELETRLNQEFENPVNRFLFQDGIEDHLRIDENRRQLTQYVTLLFHRSKARRDMTEYLHHVTVEAVDQFCANEQHVLTVATNWNANLILSGRRRQAVVTSDMVKNAARRLIKTYDTERRRQESYAESVERAMTYIDDRMYDGKWSLVKGSIDKPFIISDTPVVTWERLSTGSFRYGIGFHEPNIEAMLPISPLCCLHILPKVLRNLPTQPPSSGEVNAAQAEFSGKFCYTNIPSNWVDQIVQQNFGKAQLGVAAFTVGHRNYEKLVYEHLLNLR
jgi:hypothetical protein